MELKEVSLDDRIAETLIALSAGWEAEDINCGYQKNEYSSLEDL